MANFSKLLSLINGTSRTVDFSNNSNILELGGGGLQMDGSTSGHIVIAASATTSTYSLIWPAAQAASPGFVLSNDGTGVLSWVSASAGSVTSVAFADDSSSPIYSVSGSPITSSGTLAITLETQSANMVFAGPSSGSAAQPSFRSLVAADIPSLSAIYLPLAGGTMSGAINMGSNQINALAMAGTPALTDATNVNYVDSDRGSQSIASSGSAVALSEQSPKFISVTGTSTQAIKVPAIGGLMAGWSVTVANKTSNNSLVSMENSDGTTLTVSAGATTIPGGWTGRVLFNGTNWNINSLVGLNGSGATNFNSLQLHNVADPSSAQDAMTLNYANAHYLQDANNLSDVASASTAFKNISPLTTAGDIIFENATPAPDRLPIGSTGNVLTVVSGLPAWAPAASGSVTSVAFADDSSTPIYSISGSPVTSSGTLAITLETQSANMVFAGPASGSAAQPSFRSLVSADIPSLSAIYLPLAGGTMSGAINMGANEINDLAMAGSVALTDAVNASYVDGGRGTQTIASSGSAVTFTEQTPTHNAVTGTTAQSIKMPLTSTLPSGWFVNINNRTTSTSATIQLQNNDGTTLTVSAGGTTIAPGWIGQPIWNGTNWSVGQFISGYSGGGVSLASLQLHNVADPSSAQDAMTLNYAGAHYLALTGGTMSGAINMGSSKITNLSAGSVSTDAVNYGQVILASGANAFTANQDLGGFVITGSGSPVNPGDLVNKAYADASIAGLSWKNAVLVATTANITLSGEQTIDGFLTSGSRVLVKNQSTPSQNGIYVSAAGAWSRSSDMSAWSMVPAAAVFVQEGSVNADLGFVCTSQPGGTLGTTAITFVQFSSAGSYTADGVTLQLVSGVFSVKNAGISETQIASSALSSTGALAGGSGTKLSVNVDGSSIDINGSDQLEIAALGVSTAKIAAAAVTAAKLGAVTDGVTLDQSGAGSTIEIKAAGVSATQLATGAFDQVTIVGGAGSAAAVAQAPALKRSLVAGQSFSANTSYAVRWGLTANGETANRVYAADIDTSSFDLFYVIGMASSGTSVIAGGSIMVTTVGSFALSSSDSAFSSGTDGAPVYLTASGTFSTTAPSSSGQAITRIGMVQVRSATVPSNIIDVLPAPVAVN